MKCMQNMNVIAKISCYFERSVVTLKLRKEYLNTVTHNTPILLRIKYWTVWCIERYSMSTYTGVTNFWKQSGFLAHPVQQTIQACKQANKQAKIQYKNRNGGEKCLRLTKSTTDSYTYLLAYLCLLKTISSQFATQHRLTPVLNSPTSNNKKLSNGRDSAWCVKRSFKVTQGHPLLCQSTRHI